MAGSVLPFSMASWLPKFLTVTIGIAKFAGASIFFNGAVTGPDYVSCPEIELYFPGPGWLPVVNQFKFTSRAVELYVGPSLAPTQWRIIDTPSTIIGKRWPVTASDSGPLPMNWPR